jgi:hypothetical protein
VRFSYRVYEVSPTPASGTSDGFIHRPVIPFTLVGPSEVLDFFGLLDTGADETYLTRRMADRLGLAINDGAASIIESASGEVTVTYADATIEMTDGIEIFRWRTKVGITEQDWAEAILGHSGFLEYFDARFLGEAHEVELTRNGSLLPERN